MKPQSDPLGASQSDPQYQLLWSSEPPTPDRMGDIFRTLNDVLALVNTELDRAIAKAEAGDGVVLNGDWFDEGKSSSKDGEKAV